MRTSQLEICAETLQSCIAARDGGAHRIELCSGLSEGGVTPSHGLIRQAVLESKLPVHVMLRPRGGNFIYSAIEFDVICSDLTHAAALGAAGFVCGILQEDNTVDTDRMSQLVKLAAPLPMTFHRAFDDTPDLVRALEDVIACGCDRLLTSGGKASASEGEQNLAALSARAGGRIRIAAGGGITAIVAATLMAHTHVDLHTSLRRRLVPTAESDTRALPGSEPPLELQISDIRALLAVMANAGY
jgi:copper homeostasis protein